MKPQNIVFTGLIGLIVFSFSALAEPTRATVKISSQPLHNGRINPMLFGNFIELLDDLVPSMRAEMLNDRSCEGITRPANWAY